MVKVKFNMRVYINGLSVEAGKPVDVSEKELKSYRKNEYKIIKQEGQGIIKKGKKAKDIPAKAKDTSDITFDLDDKIE